MNENLQKLAVDMFATLLLIFGRSETLIRDGNAGQITGMRMKTFMKAAFLGQDAKVKSYMSRLEKIVDVELRMVTSITLSTSQRTEATVMRIEEVSQEVKSNTDIVVTSLKNITDVQLVINALNSPAVAKLGKYQMEYAEETLQGTCDWVKEVPLYRRWLDQSDAILWVLGGPGAGKSFLSSRIIFHLQQLYPQDPEVLCRTLVGYFYIKEDDQQLQSVSTILQSMAFQIASNNAVYHKFIAYHVFKYPQKLSTGKGLWMHLFVDFFGSSKYADHAVFLVIDGVDEAPRKSITALLRLVDELEKSSQTPERPRIQIAIISRPEIGDVASSVLGRSIRYLAMSSENNNEDIRRYAKESINPVKILKSARMKASPKERATLARKIFQKLIEHANGMFLWVRLMVDQIAEMSRPQSIYQALDAAPPGLEEIIQHIFERLANDQSVVDTLDDLNEILAWVTLARRPLLLGEIYIVLRLRSPTGEAMYLLEEKLRGSFASFFTLTENDDSEIPHLFLDKDVPIEDSTEDEEDLTGPSAEDEDFDWEGEPFDVEAEEEKTNSQSDLTLSKKLDASSLADNLLPIHFKTTIVIFSHASIRDFFLKERNPERDSSAPPLPIGVDTNKADFHIAKICLSLLCEHQAKPILEVSSLFNYAAHNFANHLISANRAIISRSHKNFYHLHLMKATPH